MMDALKLAKELKETATDVESFFSHNKAAKLMRLAAVELVRLAPSDPERKKIERVQGEVK